MGRISSVRSSLFSGAARPVQPKWTSPIMEHIKKTKKLLVRINSMILLTQISVIRDKGTIGIKKSYPIFNKQYFLIKI